MTTGCHVKQVADARLLAWETAGLEWLRTAPRRPPVVGVRSQMGTVLTLERLVGVPPTPRAAQDFGVGLAALHASGADAFGQGPPGWEGDGWIGRAPLALGRYGTWGDFYARARVLPYVRRARDAGLFDGRDVALFDRVVGRLVDGEFDDGRPPARLHGDLWSGNVVWTSAGATLIDPAAHGGHGETDLAMLALFGSPCLEVVRSSYAEAAGLEEGWRGRVALHQLHPLLVHVVLFGGPYPASARAAARQYA